MQRNSCEETPGRTRRSCPRLHRWPGTSALMDALPLHSFKRISLPAPDLAHTPGGCYRPRTKEKVQGKAAVDCEEIRAWRKKQKLQSWQWWPEARGVRGQCVPAPLLSRSPDMELRAAPGAGRRDPRRSTPNPPPFSGEQPQTLSGWMWFITNPSKQNPQRVSYFFLFVRRTRQASFPKTEEPLR